jgi:iron complex transport system permease protein
MMHPRGTIVLLLWMSMLVLALAPFFGMESVPFRALWGGVEDRTLVDILWKLRIPRVILALLAGTALATSGMTFQAMFRNPLATPLVKRLNPDP